MSMRMEQLGRFCLKADNRIYIRGLHSGPFFAVIKRNNILANYYVHYLD